MVEGTDDWVRADFFDVEGFYFLLLSMGLECYSREVRGILLKFGYSLIIFSGARGVKDKSYICLMFS